MKFKFNKLDKFYSHALGLKYQAIHQHSPEIGGTYFVWPAERGELEYRCSGCQTKLPEIMILQWRLLESE